MGGSAHTYWRAQAECGRPKAAANIFVGVAAIIARDVSFSLFSYKLLLLYCVHTN